VWQPHAPPGLPAANRVANKLMEINRLDIRTANRRPQVHHWRKGE
jgi:hypothetical protein